MIWLISLDSTIGTEIRKTCPVIIISSDDLGTLPLKVVAPPTDWKQHYAEVPWMTAILPSSQNGLEKPSSCDAIAKPTNSPRPLLLAGQLFSRRLILPVPSTP
jgi:mRNA interferase MazF